MIPLHLSNGSVVAGVEVIDGFMVSGQGAGHRSQRMKMTDFDLAHSGRLETMVMKICSSEGCF